MSRPEVFVYNMISVDGRMDCTAGDVGLYYELVAKLPHDAVLSGSGTMRVAAAAQGIDLDGEDDLPAEQPAPTEQPTPTDQPTPTERPTLTERFGGGQDAAADRRADDPSMDTGDGAAVPVAPLLVIVDSRGHLTRFDWLRSMPYWRDIVIACSATTPPGHLDLLARHGVRYVVTGDDHVDLERLLEVLAANDSVSRVRVDGGGSLNGALLRAGLVDEISVLVAPFVVGGRTPAPLFAVDALDEGGLRLNLIAVECTRADSIWLRYRLATGGAA